MLNFFRTRYPALILYLVSSVLTIIGLIFELDYLVFLAKPIIAPSIIYYYLQIVNLKFDWLFLIAVLTSFISDMFVLVDNGISIVVILLNLFVYFIFINFLLKDFFESKISLKNSHEFLIILLCFFFLLFLIMDLFHNLDRSMYYIYTFYGIILSFLSAIAVYLNLKSQNNRTLNGLLMSICFILSDIFYVLYHYQIKIEIFLVINLIAQIFSYYYMIGYIISKKA